MSENTADRHTPVMLQRCVELLHDGIAAVRHQGLRAVVIDATLGMGGHSEALLEAHINNPDVSPHDSDAHPFDLTVIGVDRDPEALKLASERLARFGDHFIAVRAVYDEIREVVAEHVGPGHAVAGVLFDLGVSSLQLDEAHRGFAYSYDAPLDMRMDSAFDSDDETAAELLSRISEADLRKILHEYGEERFASRIAKAIIRRRGEKPLTHTAELAQIVDSAVPAAAKRTGGHPAKRTFQAIRIAVNDELSVLTRAVPAAMQALHTGGRIVVLSYHSLEDRIVKRAFSAGTTSSAPPGLPVELEEHQPTFASVIRGIEVSDEKEIAENPRAASAKLRSVEKITPMVRRVT